MTAPRGAAVVTGGGRGIGRAIVAELAGTGRPVAVFDISADDAERAAAEVNAAGGHAIALAVDVSDRNAVAAAVEQTGVQLGPIEVLCNNAGIMDRMAPVHQVGFEEWDRIFAVNVDGPFALCRAVIPQMLEQGGGAIVNIASIAGIRGGRAGAAYTASKHAVVGLTRNIAWMYADAGLRCNAICPGGIDTTIADNIEFERNEFTSRIGKVGGTRPRYGRPPEIATAVGFLVSPAAAFVNGAVVPVDGAWTAA